jgi:glycerol uptake facilitator protein
MSDETNASPAANSLLRQCVAEIVGTFLLIFFGLGAVHAAVLTGAQSGLWQVAIVWGVAIMLAIYVTGGISGAHINPAITMALAAFGRFDRTRVLPYIVSQLAGAFVAACLLYALFGSFLAARESEKQVVRGEPGSIVTAMCYAEFFPNPGSLSTAAGPFSMEDYQQLGQRVSEKQAIAAEIVGTMILALVVFAVTDGRNPSAPGDKLAPVFIGLTVAALISVIAPLTQACFNPARDLGPRVFAYLAGWGSVALPGATATGWLTVYILAPIVGALLGAALYECGLRGVFVLSRGSDTP